MGYAVQPVTVGSAGITDDSIVNADINSASAIAISKLATQATSTILGNATAGTAAPTALSTANLEASPFFVPQSIRSSVITSPAIANTETVVYSITAPAGFFLAGAMVRIRAHAQLTTGATPGSGVFRCRIGTTTLTGNSAHTQTHAQNANITSLDNFVEIDVTIRTTGSGGTALGAGVGVSKGTANAFTVESNPQATTATVVVDTTVQNLVELTYISGNSGSTNTFHVATIEALNP